MLESARGWAATILFNKELKAQFDAFYARPDDAVKEKAMRQDCVALKYVDDDGNVTMEYPMNPNGSEGAVVGLTSPIYRHLRFISTSTVP